MFSVCKWQSPKFLHNITKMTPTQKASVQFPHARGINVEVEEFVEGSRRPSKD